MTTSTAAPAAARSATLRTTLRITTLSACVPYLSLKVAWIAGSRVGIPEGSPLRRDGNSLMALNALTVAMDAAVIALAFLLTRPWGQRVRSWLLALPMWAATGLIAPIFVVYPLQAVAAGLRGGAPGSGGDPNTLLDPWVWSVVYVGFIVQGLSLGTLFVSYARQRWGHLWRGRVDALGTGPGRPARRLIAGAASVLALLPAATHLLWATGRTSGLNTTQAAAMGIDSRINDAGYVLFAALVIAGSLTLARGRGRLPLLVPLAATWVSSAALACWGGWMVLTTLSTQAGDPGAHTPVMNLTYAVQMIVGILVAAGGVHFFSEREAARCD